MTKFFKAPNESVAVSEYERLVARVGRHLRENAGKPIQAKQQILVVQRDVNGEPFAALCTHFANGATPEIALQALIDQLIGGSDGSKEGATAQGYES
jgi:hypothetical protein